MKKNETDFINGKEEKEDWWGWWDVCCRYPPCVLNGGYAQARHRDDRHQVTEIMDTGSQRWWTLGHTDDGHQITEMMDTGSQRWWTPVTENMDTRSEMMDTRSEMIDTKSQRWWTPSHRDDGHKVRDDGHCIRDDGHQVTEKMDTGSTGRPWNPFLGRLRTWTLLLLCCFPDQTRVVDWCLPLCDEENAELVSGIKRLSKQSHSHLRSLASITFTNEDWILYVYFILLF